MCVCVYVCLDLLDLSCMVMVMLKRGDAGASAAALIDDLVHGGLLVAGTGDNVLIIGRYITTKY